MNSRCISSSIVHYDWLLETHFVGLHILDGLYKQLCAQATKRYPNSSEHRINNAAKDEDCKLSNPVKMSAYKTSSKVHDIFRAERSITEPVLVEREENCLGHC